MKSGHKNRGNSGNKRIRIHTVHDVSWQCELLLAVIFACAITFLEVWIQPNPLSETLYVFLHYPVVCLLNVIPAVLLILGLSAITGNVCSAAGIADLLLGMLSVANRMKVGYRNEPVWPSDLLLLREVQDAVENYSLDFPWKVIFAVIFTALLLFVMGGCLRHRKCAGAMGRRVGRRLLLLLFSAAILIGTTLTVYASDDLYYKYPQCNHYRLAAVYNEMGTTYSFLHNVTAKSVKKPTGYDERTAVNWDETMGDSCTGAQVNVILVMCEGFGDITDQGIFSFSDEDDPLRNYHALTDSSHAISGHIAVSRFGGGTANTEYDVLTGMQAAALSANTATAFYAVEQNVDSMYRVFNESGYRTLYIHPGYDWFYNRKNVFGYLGAQQVDFYDDMEDKVMKGTWVTDDYVAGRLESAFEQSVSVGQQLFAYVTTIENHTVYSYDKFGDGYCFPHIQLTKPVSDELQEIVDVYVEGLRDNDAMIGRLVQYFGNCDEPVVLSFFGDHLPSLGGNIDNYAALGIELDDTQTGTVAYLRSLETPWVLWCNDAAADLLDWEHTAASLEIPSDGLISASYLGAMVLELTGRGAYNAWTQWLNEQRRVLPVVCGDTIVNAVGTITNSLTGEQQEAVDKWACWSYYKLKEKTIP